MLGVTIAKGAFTVIDAEVVDAVPPPAAFTARIATVYAVPSVRPVIVIGLAVVPV